MQAIKGTSLAFAIGFTELSRAAAQINNVTLRSRANSGMTMVWVTYEVGFAREADLVIFISW